jgi:catechol 2,3-dioxygenase-like lactoylglutathione lyase family enzyme
MTVRAISHVAIGVTDMERSIAFYRDVIGLRVRADQTEEIPAIGNESPRKRRGVYLCFSDGPDESFIVLDQHLDVEPYGEPARLFQIGVHHFSFWVDDLDSAVERARDAACEVVFDPVEADTVTYGEPAGGRVRTTILRDPDGNLIQLDQRLQGS